MKRKIAVAINGFGRIGRLAFRAAVSNSDIDIVAINDLTDAQTLAHMLRYDSTHGRFPGEVRTEGDHLVVGDSHPRIFTEADPARLPWGDLGVEVVLESTGFFTRREQAEAHITAGARKVLISAPAQGEDATIVLGVNDDTLKPEHSRCNSNNVVGTTLPVDESPLGRSPYGLWDMSGNVYEWCEDFYDEGYYTYSPSTNPKGPEGGQERAIRGGFFGETRPNVRTTHRNSAPDSHTRDNVGFRLAMPED